MSNSFEAAKGVTDYSGIMGPLPVAKKAVGDAKSGRDMSAVTLQTKLEYLLAKFLPQSVVMDIWMKRQKQN
jgi:hypothetical protein